VQPVREMVGTGLEKNEDCEDMPPHIETAPTEYLRAHDAMATNVARHGTNLINTCDTDSELKQFTGLFTSTYVESLFSSFPRLVALM
jgi:hypothetical protein